MFKTRPITTSAKTRTIILRPIVLAIWLYILLIILISLVKGLMSSTKLGDIYFF